MLTDAPRLSSKVQDDAPSQTVYPVCPHCGADPALIGGIISQLGGMPMLVVFCGNLDCRKIHTVMSLTIQGPRTPPPPQQRDIWTPR